VSAVEAPPRVVFDQEVDRELERVDDADLDDSWWCVRTLPFPCPALGCDYVALYMTAAHRIVVWPRQDDRQMLRYSADAKQLGRDPHIVRYERAMGAAIPYDAWEQIGRPVHGKAVRPAGKPWRTF
jgi:hypothetical protein